MKNFMSAFTWFIGPAILLAIAVIWLVYSTEIPNRNTAPTQEPQQIVVHTPGPVSYAPRDYDVGDYPTWYTSVGPIIAADEFFIPDDAIIDSIRVGENVFEVKPGMKAKDAKKRPRTPDEYYNGPPGIAGNGWSIWSVAVLKERGSQEHQ